MNRTREVAERIVLDALNNRAIKQVNAFVKEDYQRLADTIDEALRAHEQAVRNSLYGVISEALAELDSDHVSDNLHRLGLLGREAVQNARDILRNTK